jgi:uncharacterized SAM-binding protein YcdF (DUF218 family)
MPRVTIFGGSSRRRLVLLSAFGIVAALGGWAFVSLGHVLYEVDPLERSDVIFVLDGSYMERPAEAAHLYMEGWAPRIILSRQLSDNAENVLQRQGLKIQSVMEAQKTAMMLIGVPESAIEIMSATRDNTAGESSELRRLLQSRGWSRIIVVTSKFHTARAGFAFRRSFNGTGIQVIVQATRYDTTDIDRWWEPRRNLRMGLFEAQSLLAYWLGLSD